MRAFYRCSGLQSVIIYEGVTSIGTSSFAYCTGLEYIEFASLIGKIGTNAFYGLSFYDGSTKLSPSAANLAGNTFEGESKVLRLIL